MDLFLIAHVAGRAVAIDGAQVDSVVDLGDVVPAPGAVRAVRGLAALRSRVVTVIDTGVALGKTPMPADAPFAQFLGELAEHRRMALLPDVAALFEQYRRESESQLLVKVTSAMALDAAQAEQLKASLKRRFKREIELDARVDASLLAGVVIDTGSEVIDGSARGRLERLGSMLAQ